MKNIRPKPVLIQIQAIEVAFHLPPFKLVATDLVIFLEVPEFLGFSGTMQVEPIH